MALTNKDVESVYQDGVDVWDIINSIQEGASQGYRDYVPLANKENVADLKHAFASNQQLLNEFVQSMVNKVVKTIMTRLMVRNVLEQFKRGSAELGDTIEEVHVNLASEHVYDAVRGETEVWKREKPDVRAFYHKRNRQVFYKQTVSDMEVVKAFNSWNGVQSLITKIINSMYGGNKNDEYKYMKLIIESAYANGAFHVVPIEGLDTDSGLKQFVEKAREYSLLVRDVNHFNPLGVDNTTEESSLYVVLPARTQAKMDVNLLASSFNMDKADFISQRVGINYFGNEDILAVLIDRDFYVVFDNLFEIRSLPNPQNLETSYWLHVHQTLSYSPFNTAIAFVKGTVPAITSLVLTPPVSVIGREGVNLTLHAKVPDSMEEPTFTTENVVYTTNNPMVTLEAGLEPNMVKVTPTGDAIPGSVITVTATYTDADEEEYTATAQIQMSTAITQP